MDTIVVVVAVGILGVIAVMLSYLFRLRTIQGMAFGRRVASTIGEVDAVGGLFQELSVRVYQLDVSSLAGGVGVELFVKSPIPHGGAAFSLNAPQCRRLAELLLEAAATPPNNSSKPTPLRGAA